MVRGCIRNKSSSCPCARKSLSQHIPTVSALIPSLRSARFPTPPTPVLSSTTLFLVLGWTQIRIHTSEASLTSKDSGRSQQISPSILLSSISFSAWIFYAAATASRVRTLSVLELPEDSGCQKPRRSGLTPFLVQQSTPDTDRPYPDSGS